MSRSRVFCGAVVSTVKLFYSRENNPMTVLSALSCESIRTLLEKNSPERQRKHGKKEAQEASRKK